MDDTGACGEPTLEGDRGHLLEREAVSRGLWLVTSPPAARVVIELVPAGEAIAGGPSLEIPPGGGHEARRWEHGVFGGAVLRAPTAPVTLQGRAGGTRDARGLGGGCIGWIGVVADHVVALDELQTLTWRAASTEAISLVVIGPQGERFCPESAVGTQPRVEGRFAAGLYEVYVGSLRPEGDPPYELVVHR